MTQTGFLNGLKVLDLSHMLAGPLAARRLGELGARVIKIETRQGETLRTLGHVDDRVDGDSLFFHAYNAGKESLALDLKTEEDRSLAERLALGADVLIQSFRPGVLEKFGLGFEQVRLGNPGVIYGSVSGFGPGETWRNDPGQDLIGQARSGLMWLTGPETGQPTPMSALICDITTANLLCQGLLAALVGRGVTGGGTHVEVSLLEAALEMQQDALPMYLHRGREMPKRSASGRHGGIWSDAPYGVYRTADGHIAVSSLSIDGMREILGSESAALEPQGSPAETRDRLFEALSAQFVRRATSHWLAEAARLNAWVVEVLSWDQLLASEGFQALHLLTTDDPPRGAVFMRTPIRFDGARLPTQAAPQVNDAGDRIRQDLWGEPRHGV